jgi:hypothetical protein
MNKDVRMGWDRTDLKSSQHVPLERLVELLLTGKPLSHSEHFHLMRCSECTQAMMQAAGAHLKGTDDSIN